MTSYLLAIVMFAISRGYTVGDAGDASPHRPEIKLFNIVFFHMYNITVIIANLFIIWTEGKVDNKSI